MRAYLARRTSIPPALDGSAACAAWAAAPWSDDFVDIEGDLRPAPRYRTRMKMLWDDEALYIAAELEEPHVWATLLEHDSVIFQDNDFEVFIDPDGDNHLYGELELNALNTTWDLLMARPYRDGGPPICGWEIAGLRTAVRVNGTLNDPSDLDVGWSLEIAMPWRSLAELTRGAAPPRPGDQWRINFSRVQWEHEVVDGRYRKVPGKPEDNWVWSPQGVVDMHRPESWGIVQFADELAEIAPLPGLSERAALMRLYAAQHEFRRRLGRWAGAGDELGPEFEAATIEATTSYFEARIGEWRVDSTSRLWRGEEVAPERPTWGA